MPQNLAPDFFDTKKPPSIMGGIGTIATFVAFQFHIRVRVRRDLTCAENKHCKYREHQKSKSGESRFQEPYLLI